MHEINEYRMGKSTRRIDPGRHAHVQIGVLYGEGLKDADARPEST